MENNIIEVTHSIVPNKNKTTDAKSDPKNIIFWLRYASKNIPPVINPAKMNAIPGIA